MQDHKPPYIPRIIRTTSASRRPRSAPPGFQLIKLFRGHHVVLPRECPPWQLKRELSIALAVAASTNLERLSAVSHESAALLWGLWLWNAPEFGHVMVETRISGPQGVRLKWHGIPRGRTFTQVQDVRVTSPAHTVLDCAQEMASDELFVLIASALRSHIGVTELQHLIADDPQRHGVRRLAALLPWCPKNCDSPLEAYCVWFALTLGLPSPETQYRVVVRDRMYLLDLAWPEARVAIELDGHVKYTSDDVWFAEKRRHDDLNNAGWRVLRLTYSDLRDSQKLRTLLLGAMTPILRDDLHPTILDASNRRWRDSGQSGSCIRAERPSA